MGLIPDEGEVPFTGQRFKLSNPESIVGVVVALVLGFAALAAGRDGGDALYNWIRQLAGQGPADGGNTIEVV